MTEGKIFLSLAMAVILLPAASCRREAFAACDRECLSKDLAETVDFVVDVDNSRALCDGLEIHFQAGDMISVNGVAYPVTCNEDGSCVLCGVGKSADGVYSCIFPAAGDFLGHSSDRNYKVPPVQFYAPGSFGRDSMPLICFAQTKDGSTPPRLHFIPAMGLLELPVKAAGVQIRTIKLENNAFNPKDGATYLSGRMAPYDASGVCTTTVTQQSVSLDCLSAVSTAMSPYIVLLCNDLDGKGVEVNGTRSFYIVVPARRYADGFTVTITDNSHRSCTLRTQGETVVLPGTKVKMKTFVYAPDEDLVFSEHFDSFVYGGDPVGYRKGVTGWRGYVPRSSGSQGGLFADKSCDGLQRSVYYGANVTATASDGTSVKECTPGSDIYTNWHTNATSDSDAVFSMDDINTAVMSESYVRSRGMWDWCPSRIIEYQGYTLVGKSASVASSFSGMTATGSPQGALKTPGLANLAASSDVRLRFRIARGFGAPSQSIRISCLGGGFFYSFKCGDVATSISPDGRYAYIDNSAALSDSDWSEAEAVVAGASPTTHFLFYAPDGSDKAKTTTFYLDDIEVFKTKIETGTLLQGTVSCDGRPVEGVAVSDGYSVVKTDNRGCYCFSPCPKAKFVFISTPSGYEPSRRSGEILGDYFRKIDPGRNNTADFALRSVNQQRYTLMVMADSHVLGGKWSYGASDDRAQYTGTFIPAAKAFIAAEHCPVYGIHLGDMTQCEYWNSYSIEKYRQDTDPLDIPVYHAIGNHDHDYNSGAYGDNHSVFESVLGPRYYSVNIGREHIVVMDDITLNTKTGQGGYSVEFSPEQLVWLKEDIAAIDSQVSRIVICTHAPVLSANGSSYNITKANGEALFSILAGYEVLCLTGHSHLDRIAKGTRGGCGVYDFVHPSLAGTAWFTHLAIDGSARCTGIYRFDSQRFERSLFAFDSKQEGRYTLYYDNVNENTGTVRMSESDPAGGRKAVIINCPNAFDCLFSESGGGKGEVRQGGIYDLDFRHFYASFNLSGKNLGNWQYPNAATHIWRYIPANPDATITIKPTDAFGNIITDDKGQYIKVKITNN